MIPKNIWVAAYKIMEMKIGLRRLFLYVTAPVRAHLNAYTASKDKIRRSSTAIDHACTAPRAKGGNNIMRASRIFKMLGNFYEVFVSTRSSSFLSAP